MNAAMAHLLRLGERSGAPTVVHIDLLSACDLACTHCYLSSRTSGGLSRARYMALIDELADLGVLRLVFSGGELFLRKDAVAIIEHARKRRFVVKAITHGGRVTDEVADTLARVGVEEISVSLYSMVSADHEAITRVAGSHAATVAGIERLRRRDVAVQLKVHVMPENRDSWTTILPWAHDLGCRVDVAAELHDKDDGLAGHATSLDVGWDSRVAMHEHLLRQSAGDRPAGGPASGCDALDGSPCGAARSLAYIGPKGQVQPCATYFWEVGNIEDQSFSEIWAQSEGLKRLRTITKRSFEACQECEFVVDCGHCMAVQHQETGDPTGRSELICTDTHATFAAKHRLGLHPDPVAAPAWRQLAWLEAPDIRELAG